MERVVQAHGANIGAKCSKCAAKADRKKLEKAFEK
jgi:NAD-dependent SIR2 family protein deacetylase